MNIQFEDSFAEFGVAKLTEKLKRLVNGSNSDMELQEKQWLDDFPFEKWDF